MLQGPAHGSSQELLGLFEQTCPNGLVAKTLQLLERARCHSSLSACRNSRIPAWCWRVSSLLRLNAMNSSTSRWTSSGRALNSWTSLTTRGVMVYCATPSKNSPMLILNSARMRKRVSRLTRYSPFSMRERSDCWMPRRAESSTWVSFLSLRSSRILRPTSWTWRILSSAAMVALPMMLPCQNGIAWSCRWIVRRASEAVNDPARRGSPSLYIERGNRREAAGCGMMRRPSVSAGLGENARATSPLPPQRARQAGLPGPLRRLAARSRLVLRAAALDAPAVHLRLLDGDADLAGGHPHRALLGLPVQRPAPLDGLERGGDEGGDGDHRQLQPGQEAALPLGAAGGGGGAGGPAARR